LDGSPKVVALAGGLFHRCALLESGAVQCWGTNGDGQLGDGTKVARPTPVTVSGIDGKAAAAVAVACAESHSCAVISDGTVRCWGNNQYGTLGDGSTTSSTVPKNVSGLKGKISPKALGLGAHHSCAVDSSGGLKCWGENAFGQLGNGTTTNSLKPVPVTGLDGVAATAVAVAGSRGIGSGHTCAVRSDGAVLCWGKNYLGQLGDGTIKLRSSPVLVKGIDGNSASAVAVATGQDHSCALLSTGAVKCWGWNDSGQLGGGAGQGDSNVPITVISIDGAKASAKSIATGSYHSCALLTTGAVTCWGDDSSVGSEGDGGVDI
jgi:alpha-tubulin suppressor-like RCC1 family protein